MSDQREASSVNDVAKRKVTAKGAVATGAGTSLVVGWSDYFFLQCFASGHFVWAPLERGLVEMTALIVLFPVALWFGHIFDLLGDIVTDWLEQRAYKKSQQ